MTHDQIITLIATNADVARCYKRATESLATVVANEKRVVVNVVGRWARGMDIRSAQRDSVEFCRSVSCARGDTTAEGRVSAAGAAVLFLAAYEDALRGVAAPEGRDAALLADLKIGAGID